MLHGKRRRFSHCWWCLLLSSLSGFHVIHWSSSCYTDLWHKTNNLTYLLAYICCLILIVEQQISFWAANFAFNSKIQSIPVTSKFTFSLNFVVGILDFLSNIKRQGQLHCLRLFQTWDITSPLGHFRIKSLLYKVIFLPSINLDSWP